MSAVDFEYCKDEAIAFGDWLCKQGWEGNTHKGYDFWSKPVWIESESVIIEHTTEELYELFLKSK